MLRTPTQFRMAIVIACFLLLGAAQSARSVGVYISEVEGTYEPGKMTPGGTLRIHLAITNDMSGPTGIIRGMTLGFAVSGSGGASWGDLSIDWSPNFSPAAYGFNVVQLPIYNADSMPPDTCAIELSVFTSGGIPAGFDEDIAIVTISDVTGPLGSMITLDSVATYGPGGLEWSIADFFGSIIDDDDFAGVTVTLDECCVGTTGNVTGGEDLVNLTDFSILRNHLFLTFEPLPCRKEANVDASPDGVINLTDITKLVNHLFITFEPLPDCP